MSSRNWGGPYAFIVLAVALGAVAAVLIWDTSSEQTKISMSRDQSARQHIEYAQDRVRRACRDRDFSALLECVTDEVVAANDHGRAESDLDAQQAMALWARLMTLASLVGLGVTAVGVYLVYGTLKQTSIATQAAQDAVAVTREIGQKQARANLDYFGCVVSDMPISAHSHAGIVNIKVIFKNFGPTPAREVVFDLVDLAELVWVPPQAPGENWPSPTFRGFDERRVKGKTNRFCGPSQTVESLFYSVPRGRIYSEAADGKFLRIAGWVRYKDDFWQSEKDYRFCKFCLMAQHPKGVAALMREPATEENIILLEHGPDNFST